VAAFRRQGGNRYALTVTKLSASDILCVFIVAPLQQKNFATTHGTSLKASASYNWQ
jgi:hypothetical protein